MTGLPNHEQTDNSQTMSDSRGHKTALESILFALAVGLGVGRVSIAPGTFGSLWGLPLVYGLREVHDHPGFLFASGIILFLVGVPICAVGIKHYQSKDPKHVVFDEIAAFPFVFMFAPLTWGTAVLGFVLFRLFDIAKPWPIRRFERLPHGWGVMADDLIAGIFACGILTIFCQLIEMI